MRGENRLSGFDSQAWGVVGKAILIGAGYVLACLVAAAVTVVLVLAPTALPDQGRMGSIYRSINDLAPMFAIGTMYTLLFAWPGFLAAVAIGERSDWTGWRRYAVAGAVNSIPSHLLLGLCFRPGFLNAPLIVLCSVAGGFVGGIAYWLTVGKWLSWRRRIRIDESVA